MQVDGFVRAPRSRKRILLVEDDGAMRSLLAEVLRDAGYTVEVAGDGMRAASSLFAGGNYALDDYDLVVTDQRMPGFDGVALTRAVRRAFGPPVILVSAFATPELARTARAAGAEAVVSKPFDAGALRAVVRSVIAA